MVYNQLICQEYKIKTAFYEKVQKMETFWNYIEMVDAPQIN